jgi:ketosteroid isomerase-like protein
LPQSATPFTGEPRSGDGTRDLEDVWGKEIRIESEAFFDLGEHTIAFNLLHGRGQQSGVEVAMQYAQVMRWREGLIVYFKAYVDREDALRDLGVTEDALEPIAP